MKRIITVAVVLGIAGCSGNIAGTDATGSGAGGVVGRAFVSDVDQRSGLTRQVLDDAGADSLKMIRAQAPTLGLTAQDDFSVLKTVEGVDGLHHVRLQQTHGGVKVFGGDLVVHSDNAIFTGVNGNVLVLQGLDLNPQLAVTVAMQTAKNDYAKAAMTPDLLAYSRETNELVILPIEGGSARLTWHVSFFTEIQSGIKPGLWHYFIDAHDGSIVQRFNGIHTAIEASGPGGNARVTRNWTTLDVTQSGSSYLMNTSQVETTNLNHGTSGTGTVASGTSLTSGFTDKAINDAHGFAEVTLQMLTNWMGYNSIDNAGFKILSRVHYSSNYENAFWDGQEMSYGDGGSTLYQMSGALDVVAHEIDHGFTSNHSNLTYTGQSGGMNESFSDIAGQAAKFYYSPSTATWDLGGDIFKQAGQAVRYMCNPTQDGGSIDNASDYNSGLDVHYSSGVMNKAFCLASKRISSGSPTGTATADGVHKAAKAWYVANANYWTSSATFKQGCQGVVDAAKSLGYSAADIQSLGDSWKDVGVTCNYASGGGGGGTDGGTGGGVDGGTGGGGGMDGGTGGGGGGGGSCSHPICSTGTRLTSSCDPCATKICAADSYCCTTAWDNQCVGEVASICGQSTCSGGGGGGGGGSTCSHSICSTGGKLTSSCDPCAQNICAADGYCCQYAWDSICVSEVASICGQSCK
jgi:Zn-dependent metalloprotease